MTDESFSIRNWPKTVGYWKFPGGGVYWASTRKPNIFHRTMMRIILGLEWREDLGTED